MGEPAKYRKKPVVIEAFQYHDHRKQGVEDWPEWAVERLGDVLRIDTLEGVTIENRSPHTVLGRPVVAKDGDWVLLHPDGFLSVCKPDIFDATYEPLKSHR